MDLGLSGKVAVVTGGSVGIGLGVARAFAREGAHVLIAARDSDRVVGAAADITREFGVDAVGHACDVATADGCASLVEAARAAFGGADILVNNAGTGSNETILDAPDDKWQAYWDLHVMAAVRLARGLVPMMAAARRRRDPEQRLDLRGAAALVRADLQRHQGRAADALEEHGDRVHPDGHPGQHGQPRPDPHPRLDQDRQAALGRQRRRLGGLPPVGRRRARPDQALRHRRGARRLHGLPLLDRARPTPSAPPITSTAACSAPSEEAPTWPPVSLPASARHPRRRCPRASAARLRPRRPLARHRPLRRRQLPPRPPAGLPRPADERRPRPRLGDRRRRRHPLRREDARRARRPGLALHRRRAVGRDLLGPRHRGDDRLPAADGRRRRSSPASPTRRSASSR